MSGFLRFGFVCLIAASGFGQVRTWVSATGLDSNPCSRAAPCRNFNAAIAAVANGGEVVVLDSAGYGPTVITKSVSVIVPEGLHAAIAPTSGNAIVINAPSAVLRGLYLNNQGSTSTALEISSTGLFFIENMIIDGFEDAGGINSDFAAEIRVTGVTIRRCLVGIRLDGSSLLYVDDSRFEENGLNGIALFEGVKAYLQDSVFSGNGNTALLVNPTLEGYAAVHRCTFAKNGTGIATGAGGSDGVVDVSASHIVDNLTSIQITAGDAINSAGDNIVRHNGTTNPFSNTFNPQ